LATDRALVRQAFFDRIESDSTFYQYYGDLADDEIQALANERANTYIKEAITLLKRKCNGGLTFAVDEIADKFTEDLTDEEIQLIGGDLAFEVYIARDIAKMKTRINTFTSSDLKALHSPANERKSFMDMYQALKVENAVKISDYSARDRSTGRFKSVNVEGVPLGT
jgi:hypothetical protein